MFSVGIVAQNFAVFENDIFDCKVLWIVGEGEWNSVGFFVLSGLMCGFLVNFSGALFACGYSRVRVAAFLKNWRISSHLSLKSASSLQRRLCLRN